MFDLDDATKACAPEFKSSPRADLFTLKSYYRPDFTDHRSSYVVASKYNTQMRKIKQQKKMNGKKEK